MVRRWTVLAAWHASRSRHDGPRPPRRHAPRPPGRRWPTVGCTSSCRTDGSIAALGRDAAGANDRHGDIRPIGDDPVDTPIQQTVDVFGPVHRPHGDGDVRFVRIADEARRDHAHRPGHFRDLELAVGRTAHRPAHPRSVQREARFLARRAGRDAGSVLARRPQHARAERSERDTVEGGGGTNRIDRPARKLGIVRLQLDDATRGGITAEHLVETRHATGQPAKRMRRGLSRRSRRTIRRRRRTEMEPGIETRELVGCVRGDRTGAIGRPLQRRIVMDDDNAVAREADVELGRGCPRGRSA